MLSAVVERLGCSSGLVRGDGAAVRPYAAAVGAAAGAWLLLAVPLPVLLLVVAAFVWRPNAVLAFTVFACLAGFFGERAAAGLVLPVEGAVEGWVVLLDDPRPIEPNGARVTVRHMGKRFEARARGPVAGRFRDVLAGERMRITGVVEAAAGDWQRWRHIVGRITVESVGGRASAAPLAAFANGIRRLLARGALSLPDDDRSLFSGMVYGDDREQSHRLADDFRAAGLGHLLVVSGQNVAFVLALASPLVGRLRPGVRLVVLLVVLGVFAMLTRFEPSVLRAVAMAAVAVTSAALGRPAQGRSTLAWAIAGVLVIDPFVVRMLAFRLSVCATAGLLWITPPLARMLPGPRSLRLALATTAGAQLAVMPLLIAAFGTVPLASLPANLLAGPASGPVMMWGLTAGFVAGLLGGWAAWLVHLPTAALLWWVRFVAAGAAAAPPAVLGASGAAAVTAGTALALGAWWASRRGLPAEEAAVGRAEECGVDAVSGCGADGGLSGSQGVRWTQSVQALGVGVVLAAFAHSVSGAVSPSPGWSVVDGASVFSHRGGSAVVVLDQPGSPRRLLESLRLHGVRRIGLIVAADGDAADAHAVVALLDRHRGALVLAPPMHRVPRARTATEGTAVALGAVRVSIVADDPALEVRIGMRAAVR